MNFSKRTYQTSGVNIRAAEETVRLIARHAASTFNQNVLRDVGFFGGFYRLGQYQDPVLVSSTDSVGTKVKIAALMDRYDTVGIDIVNHCVNDIFVGGAAPLFFLDYIAVSRLEPQRVADLVKGIALACKDIGCALIGGETAQMPDIYHGDDFDLVGFIVGVVEKDQIIDGSSIQAGDILIGIPSSGPHTNGYSLVRRVFRIEEEAAILQKYFEELGRTLGEELLEPHRSYYRLLKDHLPKIKGMAHITGGGLPGNVPRTLPEGLAARFKPGSWQVLPIFDLIQKTGNIDPDEMYRVFNMGLGMVVVAAPENADSLASSIQGASIVGEIVKRIDERRVLL